MDLTTKIILIYFIIVLMIIKSVDNIPRMVRALFFALPAVFLFKTAL